ncbi:MAG: zinc ribbon domain-containing protein [Polyangiaceae bacterium]|nr:zinc ribbon domain-containing protein [Polyangiaceae bacterium]
MSAPSAGLAGRFPAQLLTTRVAPAAFIVASVGVGLRAGLGSALLVLAFGLLLLVVALLWASVARLTDPAALEVVDALELAGTSAEEERKRAVLRALKDLEHERALGKVSEVDYAALAARYRDEARELLRRVDALGEAAERELAAVHAATAAAEAAAPKKARRARRAEAAPGGAPTEPEAAEVAPTEPEAASAQPAAEPAEPAGEPETERAQSCRACGTANDAAARFCDACGTSLAAEDA